MNMKVVILAALSASALIACGNKTDANEKNFGTAMNKLFDEKGHLCLVNREMPVDVDMSYKLYMDNLPAVMSVLEGEGLVEGVDAEVKDTFGKMRKVRRFTYSDKAKPYVQQKKDRQGGTYEALCWSKLGLDKIVKWEGPMALGDYKVAAVTYTYKLVDMAEWAKRPEVQAVVPNIKKNLEGAGSKEITTRVGLSSLGWEADDLDVNSFINPFF